MAGHGGTNRLNDLNRYNISAKSWTLDSSKLKVLDFSESCLTDKRLPTSLETVILRYNDISPESVQQLNQPFKKDASVVLHMDRCIVPSSGRCTALAIVLGEGSVSATGRLAGWTITITKQPSIT